MAIQQRPNMENIWAALGGVAIPSQEKILEGWIEEIPLNIIANWIEQRQDKALLYLLQQGIADWGSATKYPKNCFTKLNGKLYISLNPSSGISPEQAGNTAWAIAFDEYGAAKAVRDLVEEIITKEGKLPLYVSKKNPVMTGDAKAPSFRASVGVPATLKGNNHVGFTFDGEDNTGLFKNTSGMLAIYKAGSLVARFNSDTANATGEDVVTVDMLREYMKSYEVQVGASIITNRPENPATYLKYGTWVQDCLGKAIVGVTTDNTVNSPDWVKSVDNSFGSYNQTLTTDQLPQFEYGVAFVVTRDGWGDGIKDVKEPDVFSLIQRKSIGENQPHNNVQPSQTKYIFTRTA